MNRKTEVIENKEVWRKKNVSFLRRKRAGVKMLEKPALSAAKVATFNDRGKVSEYYFATI